MTVEGRGLYGRSLWRPGTMRWDELRSIHSSEVEAGFAKEWALVAMVDLVGVYGDTGETAMRKVRHGEDLAKEGHPGGAL